MSEKTKVTEMPIEETGIPSQEEVNETEYSLIEGLLGAAGYAEDEDLRKEIRIARNGKFFFKFTVRPLSEDEIRVARKNATKMINNPAGKKLPKIEGDVDMAALRSWKIYFATIEEDRDKIWENQEIKRKYNLMRGYESVDVLLTGGEKSSVIDIIDDISGFGEDLDLTEYAKN